MNNEKSDPRFKKFKTPTQPKPSMEDLEYWVMDGVCEATDGCRVEPDGYCKHGYVSWLIYYSLI